MADIDKSEIIYQGLDIVKLAEQALQKPDDFGWWGSDQMFVSWGWAGIDQHNASDAIQIVNFELITKDLMSRFPDDFDIVGLRHWAVGHVDRLTCRILINPDNGINIDNITEAFCASMEWLIQLDDYPIVDDDKLHEYCVEETIQWIEQEIPFDVYVKESKRDTAEAIFAEISSIDDYDPVGWVLDGMYPTEEVIRYAAYDLSLCSAEHRDVWDEWVEEQGLPPIYWGDNFGAPANVMHKIDGQLSLFGDDDGSNG